MYFQNLEKFKKSEAIKKSPKAKNHFGTFYLSS